MRTQYTSYEIVQLVAAPPGWVVVMQSESGAFVHNDVACFALAKCVERACPTGEKVGEETISVVCMIGGEGLLEIAESFEGFYGCFGPNDPQPLVKQAQVT